jgi:hypothetical protein
VGVPVVFHLDLVVIIDLRDAIHVGATPVGQGLLGEIQKFLPHQVNQRGLAALTGNVNEHGRGISKGLHQRDFRVA